MTWYGEGETEKEQNGNDAREVERREAKRLDTRSERRWRSEEAEGEDDKKGASKWAG